MDSPNKLRDKHPQLDAYRKTDIVTANRETILLMMYGGAIRFLIKAISAMEDGKLEEKGRYIVKVQDIVNELRATLDFKIGGELAQHLDSLYDFISQKLLLGNLNKDPQSLREALNVLVTLNSGWQEAVASLKKERTG